MCETRYGQSRGPGLGRVWRGSDHLIDVIGPRRRLWALRTATSKANPRTDLQDPSLDRAKFAAKFEGSAPSRTEEKRWMANYRILTPQTARSSLLTNSLRSRFLQSIDRQTLKNNVIGLAKAADGFWHPDDHHHGQEQILLWFHLYRKCSRCPRINQTASVPVLVKWYEGYT